MSETFSGGMKVNVQGTLTGSPALGSSNFNVNYTQSVNLLNGSGLNQADILFTNTYTISASSSTTLNLYGSLVDAYGNTINMTSVKGLIIYAYSANTNNVLVGGAASNPWYSWIGSNTDSVIVRPGGTMALFAPDATGYAVTSSTACNLKLANSSSGTSVTCDLIVIGVQ